MKTIERSEIYPIPTTYTNESTTNRANVVYITSCSWNIYIYNMVAIVPIRRGGVGVNTVEGSLVARSIVRSFLRHFGSINGVVVRRRHGRWSSSNETTCSLVRGWCGRCTIHSYFSFFFSYFIGNRRRLVILLQHGVFRQFPFPMFPHRLGGRIGTGRSNHCSKGPHDRCQGNQTDGATRTSRHDRTAFPVRLEGQHRVR